jgi:hypothetical protein
LGCELWNRTRHRLSLVLKRMFPRLMTFTATGRSTGHTKCRNEVEDLKRSVKLRGRAVAENENEAGNRTIMRHVSYRLLHRLEEILKRML